jgi:lysophospholipase L1-like esterase
MKHTLSFASILVVLSLVCAGAVFAQAASPSPAASHTPRQTMAQPETQSPAPAGCSDLPTLKQHLAAVEKQLQDWPELGRYREANATLAPPAKEELRAVFLGDSITDIWGHVQEGGFFPGKPYVNRGIGGQTTPQMLLRFRPDVIALQPKVVVILAGTNDIAGNTGPMPLSATEDNLATMVELARRHGIRVVLSSLLPDSDYGHTREGAPVVQTERRPPQKILELNEWLRKYAGENDCVYLDYFSHMVDEHGMLRRELSDDGLHPNAQGFSIMAPLAEQAIHAALGMGRSRDGGAPESEGDGKPSRRLKGSD